MSYRKIKVKSPFDVERYRQELAASGKVEALKSTYGVGFPEIENLNTDRLWDRLNLTSYFTFQSNPMAYNRLQTAVDYLGKIKGKLSILDIGFGRADFERIVQGRSSGNVDIIGLDVSGSSVSRARKEFPHWRFTKDTIESSNINGKFDCIVVLEVLEHVSPRYTLIVLNKVHRMLKSNGRLIVSVPLNERLEELVKSGSNLNAHVRMYTKELIETELRIAGFQVVKYRLLYAFHKAYWIKTIAARLLGFGKKPNNIILLAKKV